jgi:hypothetical protein
MILPVKMITRAELEAIIKKNDTWLASRQHIVKEAKLPLIIQRLHTFCNFDEYREFEQQIVTIYGKYLYNQFRKFYTGKVLIDIFETEGKQDLWNLWESWPERKRKAMSKYNTF